MAFNHVAPISASESHGLLPAFSSSFKDTSHVGLGPTLRTSDHPSMIPSAKTLFPNKVHSQGLRVRTSTYHSGGHSSTHYTIYPANPPAHPLTCTCYSPPLNPPPVPFIVPTPFHPPTHPLLPSILSPTLSPPPHSLIHPSINFLLHIHLFIRHSRSFCYARHGARSTQ